MSAGASRPRPAPGLRVAVLAHSTNPRGGVVHAMQLAEALCDLGRRAAVLAPDPSGRGFPRTLRCPAVSIPARPASGNVLAMAGQRIGEVADFLRPRTELFDVFHAQDPLTANALATLAAEGRIAGFARTVHHLDDHADPRLAALQDRGVRDAAALCCVSGLWRRTLRARYGRDAVPVGNGVDGARFSSGPRGMAERDLRARLGIPPDGRLVLALGGVEARKNTLGLLHGFALLRRRVPDVRLLVAGGATLLDHAAYRRSFDAGLAAHGIGDAVHLAGVVADADMPALYAMADVFACVSLNEGFGLCVIEALAAGRPVVVSGIEPFTEHLGRDDVLWADPVDPGSVASALAEGLLPGARGRFAALGPTLAAGFGWDRVAAAHGPVHASLARAAERFRPGAAGTWADGPARTEMSDA